MNWVLFWTTVAALGSCAIVIVTAFYTYYTLQLWRAQTEPNVIVYVKHDADRPSMITIVIENIGRDIAHDVTFKPSRPIPSKCWGLTAEDAEPPQSMTGPLVSGIPSLGPSDTRVINWGQYGGLSKALGKEPIVVNYQYRAGTRTIQRQSTLEVESFADTSAAETAAAQMARHLESLSKSVTAIRDDLRKFAATSIGPSAGPKSNG